MKFNKITLLTIPLFVVLALSLTFNSTTTLAQTETPFLNTETGDDFGFSLYGDKSFTSTRDSFIWNQSDVNDIWREESENRNEIIQFEGWMDVFFVNDANVSGDRWVIIERETHNLIGSQAVDSFFVFDKNGQDNRDESFTRDLSGEGRFDEDNSEVFSNATYSVLFEEFFDEGTYVDIEPIFRNESSTFDGFAPLTSMDVTVGSGQYDINTVSMNLTVKTVSMTFSLLWTENTMMSFPWGPQDDPNTLWVDYNVSQTLVYDQTLQYYYDNDNGVLLGSWTDVTGSLTVDMSAKDIEFNQEPPATGPSLNVVPAPQLLDANQTINLVFSSTEGWDLEETNAWYGNTRLQSSGTNRLEEGDVLSYTLDSRGRYDSFFDVEMNDGVNPIMTRNDNGFFESIGEGTAEIRVWRHDPGFVDAVIVIRQDIASTEERHFSDSDPSRPDENTVDSFFDVFFELDQFSTPSNTAHELEAELDQVKFYDLGDDNRDDRDECRDKCDDGFRIPAPRDLPLVGESRTEFIPEDENNPGEPELININGFDYVLLVEGLEGEYKRTWDGKIDIRLGDEPNSPNVMADVHVEAFALQGFYWDTATGVLVAMEEESNIFISIDFHGSVMIFDDGGTAQSVQVDIHGEIMIENEFFMLLNGHPRQYLEAQTEIPTISTPTTTTTVDTISSSTTTSSEDGNGADLPLPVPIVPVLIGFAIMTVYTRKRM